MTDLAVLDAGKTNAELIALSSDDGILEQSLRSQQVETENGLRALVSDGAFRWLEAALAALNLVARVLRRET
jgi:hypothetical protein